MTSPIVVTLAPERDRTRVLARNGEQEILRAALPSQHFAHPRAAQVLLESLALWHQSSVSAVLVVDEQDPSSAGMCLYDALGFPERSLHYEVGLASRLKRGRRRQSLGALADFGDLRRERLELMR